jgi:hypothetical protein
MSAGYASHDPRLTDRTNRTVGWETSYDNSNAIGLVDHYLTKISMTVRYSLDHLTSGTRCNFCWSSRGFRLQRTRAAALQQVRVISWWPSCKYTLYVVNAMSSEKLVDCVVITYCLPSSKRYLGCNNVHLAGVGRNVGASRTLPEEAEIITAALDVYQRDFRASRSITWTTFILFFGAR